MGFKISHIGHYFSEAINNAFDKANEYGHKWFGGGPGHEDEGGTDWYIGYNSNNGWNININPGQTPYTQTQQQTPGYNYGTVTKNNTQSYSRTTAATAKDIAQGGMTKDEVIEFNIKHPNETAGYNPGYETSLNTNTARSK